MIMMMMSRVQACKVRCRAIIEVNSELGKLLVSV